MDKFVVAVIVTLFLIIGLTAYFSVQEANDWSVFAEQHHCVEIGKRHGVPIYIRNGNIMTPIPQTETGYRCDDGKEYWR